MLVVKFLASFTKQQFSKECCLDIWLTSWCFLLSNVVICTWGQSYMSSLFASGLLYVFLPGCLYAI